MQTALFIDRDKTINRDDGYEPKLELYDDIPLLFNKVKELGLPVIVISNQSAVSQNKTTRRAVEDFNDWLSILVGYPMKFYYCPHQQQAGCACRKPEPGLIYKAAIENDINIGNSFFIGDSVTDIQAARKAGMFNYLLARKQNFSPTTSAYLMALNIPVYTMKEIIEQIEEIVYLQRNRDKHFKLYNYRDMG